MSVVDASDTGHEREHAALERTLAAARTRLLDERGAHGHWEGELSSSALSTATAAAALTLAARATPDPERAHTLAALAARGRAWLAANANADGGYGDTVDSPSNVSTTLLAWMALSMDEARAAPAEGSSASDSSDPSDSSDTGGGSESVGRARARAARWITRDLGGLDSRTIARGLAAVYGEDKTFAVPILTACAAAGAFASEPGGGWRSIPSLPFELAALPQSLFRFLGLPVVSYALPALIAIGQAIHHHKGGKNPLRGATRAATLRVLERIQPTGKQGGGFLEATPLTSFVALSLISMGHANHVVVERALAFLERSIRDGDDGGAWPIDTNLATWGTTLAIGALSGGDLFAHFTADERGALLDWLLAQRFREVHPYTGAAPGGWAWTDLPGGVPDADDTPGALLALDALRADAARKGETAEAARAGVRWLCDLQNADGGMPTFCRGWGTLPFDMSCPDLTAHAMRAWHVWRERVGDEALGARIDHAVAGATHHLVREQRADGAWVPLWFGNQHAPGMTNPVYATSRVLRACRASRGAAWRRAIERGTRWLLAAQHPDGGFGGAPGVPPSIEETGLALEGLADVAEFLRDGADARTASDERESLAAIEDALARGCDWLAAATEEGTRFDARPIGLYFARLWYSERLYPIVFCVSALERCAPLLEERARGRTR